MKKYLFCTIVYFLFGSVLCFSQDTIIFLSGNSVEAKIERITNDEVEYRMWNYQTGPIRVKKTSDIKMIKYGNGQRELFTFTEDTASKNSSEEKVEQTKESLECKVPQVNSRVYDRQLVVTHGSQAILREKEFAVVEFDFSNTSWENETTFKAWCGEDYEYRVNLAQTRFINSFNERSKGLLLKTTDDDVKYKLVLRIDILGHYLSNWSMYMLCSGEVDIYDIHQPSTPVCTIKITDLDGPTDRNINDRIEKCFDAIAYELTRLRKKTSIR
ncbi:MAG: hypothetical protein K6E93_03195 [Bacteroidales bacterium]|nr:hypothetical protein [Bacteroidales bacterium]